MIIDKELMFSDAQAVTSTAASTNIIDLGVDRDLGDMAGKNLTLVVKTGADAFASTGSSTLTIALQTDSTSAFSSATALWTSASIAKASLTADTVVAKIPVPRTTERYLRLNYTVGTADFTAGALTSALVLDAEGRKDYPDAL